MNSLYKINDVLNENFIRLPLAIIANPKYKILSSDAKILYSLLCNRLRLSQINNWVNDMGEVYLIYKREQAAEVLGISYSTSIRTFKELIKIGLIFEVRRGNNLPNHIYISKLENCDSAETKSFNSKFDPPSAPEKAICQNETSENTDIDDNGVIAPADVSNLQFRNCKNEISGDVRFTYPDVSNLHTIKKEKKKKNLSEIELSQSISHCTESTLTDGLTLESILDSCELDIFEDHARNIYASAIERLYFSDYYKIGNVILPKNTIRSYLHRLDAEALTAVHDTLCRNTKRIKNPIGYVMSLIINAVCEKHIELYAYSQFFKEVPG